jgi:hypothetical protein
MSGYDGYMMSACAQTSGVISRILMGHLYEHDRSHTHIILIKVTHHFTSLHFDATLTHFLYFI